MNILSQTDTKNVRRLVSFVEEFRKIDPEMQAQQILLFLHVAGKSGISMKELASLTGLAPSSVSRNVAALSNLHRKGHPGHDLMVAYEDPDDRRNKLVKLTYKGQLVYRNLVETLGN